MSQPVSSRLDATILLSYVKGRTAAESLSLPRKAVRLLEVGGVVDLPAEREFDTADSQVVADRSGVRDRAGEPVEFLHDEGVTFPDGSEGLVEPGAFAVGAGQAVVEVDPLLGDAELDQPVVLGGEVLFVGGAADVA